MTELEKKLSSVRKDLLDDLRADLDNLRDNSRVKEVEKKIVFQTGYGKTEYFHYSLNVPPIIVSNNNGNETNT